MNTLSKSILPVITIALLVTNCFLIYQNLNLKSQLQYLAPKQIKEGTVLADFEGKDLNGNATKINYEGNDSKRVLLYFHPACGWCKKQMPYWKELVSKADTNKFKIVAVTTDDNRDAIKKYVDAFDISSWKVVLIKKEDAGKAELSGTPATVVLDDQGKIEKVWVGMWREHELVDAGKYFNMNFTAVKTE
jgi:peroxiredoxin